MTCTQAQSSFHERYAENFEKGDPQDLRTEDILHPDACAGHSREGHSSKESLSGGSRSDY